MENFKVSFTFEVDDKLEMEYSNEMVEESILERQDTQGSSNLAMHKSHNEVNHSSKNATNDEKKDMCRKETSISSNQKEQRRTKIQKSSKRYEKDVRPFASRNSRKSVVKIEAPDDEVQEEENDTNDDSANEETNNEVQEEGNDTDGDFTSEEINSETCGR